MCFIYIWTLLGVLFCKVCDVSHSWWNLWSNSFWFKWIETNRLSKENFLSTSMWFWRIWKYKVRLNNNQVVLGISQYIHIEPLKISNILLATIIDTKNRTVIQNVILSFVHHFVFKCSNTAYHKCVRKTCFKRTKPKKKYISYVWNIKKHLLITTPILFATIYFPVHKYHNGFFSLTFTDIDECGSSPCVHGICQDQINGYMCNCSKGFTGSNCETGNLYDWLLTLS